MRMAIIEQENEPASRWREHHHDKINKRQVKNQSDTFVNFQEGLDKAARLARKVKVDLMNIRRNFDGE